MEDSLISFHQFQWHWSSILNPMWLHYVEGQHHVQMVVRASRKEWWLSDHIVMSNLDVQWQFLQCLEFCVWQEDEQEEAFKTTTVSDQTWVWSCTYTFQPYVLAHGFSSLCSTPFWILKIHISLFGVNFARKQLYAHLYWKYIGKQGVLVYCGILFPEGDTKEDWLIDNGWQN